MRRVVETVSTLSFFFSRIVVENDSCTNFTFTHFTLVQLGMQSCPNLPNLSISRNLIHKFYKFTDSFVLIQVLDIINHV